MIPDCRRCPGRRCARPSHRDALHDSEHNVDHADVAEQEIERALLACDACSESRAIAKSLSAAMQAFVAVNRMVFLDNGDQQRVCETEAVADRRPVKLRVGAAGNRGRRATLL